MSLWPQYAGYAHLKKKHQTKPNTHTHTQTNKKAKKSKQQTNMTFPNQVTLQPLVSTGFTSVIEFSPGSILLSPSSCLLVNILTPFCYTQCPLVIDVYKNIHALIQARIHTERTYISASCDFSISCSLFSFQTVLVIK